MPQYIMLWKYGENNIFKMVPTRVCLVVFAGVLGFQLVVSNRIARSPNKMEIEGPDYSSDREHQSQELHDRRDEEQDYWERERERGEERYSKEKEDNKAKENGEEGKEEFVSKEERYREEGNKHGEQGREDIENHEYRGPTISYHAD